MMGADPSSPDAAAASGFPRLARIGIAGLLVSFADRLSESANRAALAFRAAVERESWPGVEETSASLASVFIGFDPLHLTHAALSERLRALLDGADWYASALPGGRRLWHIPTVFGGPLAPQFDAAAALAGMTPEAALAALAGQRLRVLTIGFAPGLPYLGTLPPAWDLPRQSALTGSVPEGALVVAVRQMVLFSAPSPTGWRHIGQTAFRCFRPEAEDPFALRAGDEVAFLPIGAEELAAIGRRDTSGNGGAQTEALG